MKGIHIDGKGDDDVEKVLVEYQYCPYLPTNLGSYFRNLEILYVMKSNVMHLAHGDLDGLTKLRIFDVSYNPIKRLHKDYFKGHATIEIISFYDCKLRFIEKGALEPLVNLKEGHFQYNECIDYRGEDVSMLPNMMEEVKANCEDPSRTDFSHLKEESTFDPFDDYSGETYKNPATTLKATRQPSLTTTDKFSKDATSTTNCDSFVRCNAYAIIIVLLFVLIAFGLVLFKLNAFNRQNWR